MLLQDDLKPLPHVTSDWDSRSVVDLIALGLAVGAIARIKKLKDRNQEPKQGSKDIFNKAVERAASRLLPGAHMVRSGRPMTDIMSKIKKQQRRALNSERFKYRKSVKAQQKNLVLQSRAQSKRPYK